MKTDFFYVSNLKTETLNDFFFYNFCRFSLYRAQNIRRILKKSPSFYDERFVIAASPAITCSIDSISKKYPRKAVQIDTMRSVTYFTSMFAASKCSEFSQTFDLILNLLHTDQTPISDHHKSHTWALYLQYMLYSSDATRIEKHITYTNTVYTLCEEKNVCPVTDPRKI